MYQGITPVAMSYHDLHILFRYSKILLVEQDNFTTHPPYSLLCSIVSSVFYITYYYSLVFRLDVRLWRIGMVLQ